MILIHSFVHISPTKPYWIYQNHSGKALVHTQIVKTISPWIYGAAIVVLLFVFSWLGKLNPATSIYKSPEIKVRFMAIYDEKLAAWPVPYKDVFV